jgi:hypothetical protein
MKTLMTTLFLLFATSAFAEIPLGWPNEIQAKVARVYIGNHQAIVPNTCVVFLETSQISKVKKVGLVDSIYNCALARKLKNKVGQVLFFNLQKTLQAGQEDFSNDLNLLDEDAFYIDINVE